MPWLARVTPREGPRVATVPIKQLCTRRSGVQFPMSNIAIEHDPEPPPYRFGKEGWNSISNLPIAVGGLASKAEPVGKCLQPCCLTHRKGSVLPGMYVPVAILRYVGSNRTA